MYFKQKFYRTLKPLFILIKINISLSNKYFNISTKYFGKEKTERKIYKFDISIITTLFKRKMSIHLYNVSIRTFTFTIFRVALKSCMRKLFYDLFARAPGSFVSGCYSSANLRRSIFSADFPRQKATSPFFLAPSPAPPKPSSFSASRTFEITSVRVWRSFKNISEVLDLGQPGHS